MYLATVVATAVLATAAFAVSAQTPAAPATPGATASTPGAAPEAKRHHRDPAKMQERMAQRQAELKQKLQLTPAQEASWSSFTNALKPSGARQRMDREALARMNTPDRIDHLRALRNARIAEMDRRAEATKAFYATLTPEQQKTFDAETLRIAQRGVHGYGHKHRSSQGA
jgi:Spy/CpxP family protein refolding chaperone